MEPAQGDMGDSTGKTPPYTGKRVGTHAELTQDFTLTVNPWVNPPVNRHTDLPHIGLLPPTGLHTQDLDTEAIPGLRPERTELNWTEIWGMRFNVNKCNVMTLARCANSFSYFYQLNNTILDRVNTYDYLGIYHLWKPQLNRPLTKCKVRQCTIRLLV